MTATKTTATEFAAFVADLVARKANGERLTETRDGYRVEISTTGTGLYGIDVRGPQNSWTRRRDVSKVNVSRVAAELHAEIDEEIAPKPETTTIPVETMRPGYRYWSARPGYESNWTIAKVEIHEAEYQVDRGDGWFAPTLVTVTRRDGDVRTFEYGEQIAIQGPFKTP